MKFLKANSSNSLEELEVKARLASEQRRYKDAIHCYKDLLKQGQNAEWTQSLALAYRLRAEQVAAKGMWQEATILWESYAKLCPGTKANDEYLGWLAQAGQFPKLAQWLAGPAEETGDSPFVRRLLEVLAVLALQNEKLLAAFPKDHALPKHHAFAKQGIRAFSQGRDAETEAALKQIPSRSPYRNVRTLVKALLLLHEDRAASLALLQRIEPDSPCQGLARQLLGLCPPSGPDLSLDTELPPKQQVLVGKLNGYNKARLGLFKDAKKFGKDSTPRQVLNAVLAHREALGVSASRNLCFSLLVRYPEGLDAYQKAFGKLDEFQRLRLLALHDESNHRYAEASWYWKDAIGVLNKRPEAEREPLDQALIHRHVATEAKRGGVPKVAITALEESLLVDPDDRECYLELIKLYEEIDDPKQAQARLEQGLRRFPKDLELLTLAMREAARRKAFKKAAGIAKTLLSIDPVNTPARQFLLDAHLGHARKQARAGKHHLASQELGQARELDSRRKSAALCLLEGLLALQDTGRATALLKEGWQLAGGGVTAQFQLNLETLSLGLALKATAGLAPPLPKSHEVSREELLALAVTLGQYREEDSKRIAEALKPLKVWMNKALRQIALSEDEYFSLCQTFANTKQFESLTTCVKEAQSRFPFAASPIYFGVLARCKGIATRLSEFDERRLEYALERAKQNQDHRTGLLIDKLFREYDEAFEEDDSLDDFMPDLEDMQSKLTPALQQRIAQLETLPQAELLKIINHSMPGMPVQGLPRKELVSLASLALMGEMGVNLKSLLDGLA